MYSLAQYEALNRWVYEQLVRGELPPKRRLEYLIFLNHNDMELFRKYEQGGLCPICKANLEAWREVFGEEHKCEVRDYGS